MSPISYAIVSGMNVSTTITGITLNNTSPNQIGFMGQLFLKNTSPTGTTINNNLSTPTLQIDYPSNSAILITAGSYVTALLLCDGITYYLNFAGPYNP